MVRQRYINPFTDFGFKRLFGKEANKDILLDFLNELLREEEGEIKEINFKKNENIGSLDLDRRAIFDIYCENEKGEKFIVEMQKARQNYFKDRSVFYSTFPIRDQAEKGDWNYKLKSVYTIGILDFIFEEDKKDKDKFFYRVKLADIDTNKVFYKKLSFYYLEMPKFNKTLEECVTHFDKWLYVLKNISKLDRIPTKLQEKVFTKIFGEAEIANYNREELIEYEEDLKVYRDMKGVLETAREEGIKKGRKEGFEKGIEKGIEQGIEKERHLQEDKRKKEKIKTAKNLLSMGLTPEQISKATGLSVDEITKL